jgi:hypothetical protein
MSITHGDKSTFAASIMQFAILVENANPSTTNILDPVASLAKPLQPDPNSYRIQMPLRNGHILARMHIRMWVAL